MNLTPAEQWAAEYQLPDRVTFIRQIQADAIRHARFVVDNTIEWRKALLDLADQLHPKSTL